jgi:8-oxo-dGTP diphosphatase
MCHSHRAIQRLHVTIFGTCRVTEASNAKEHEVAIYCQTCGALTSEQDVEGRSRPVCIRCGTVTYLDPKLAVAVLIGDGGRILLGKRGTGTRQSGRWSFPAGFVERGERVEDAARREAKEETGLNIRVGSLLGIWSQTGESVVLAAFAARIEDGIAVPGDDLDELA